MYISTGTQEAFEVVQLAAVRLINIANCTIQPIAQPIPAVSTYVTL